MPSAYIVPKCGGGKYFLVGMKEVLSYQALASLDTLRALNQKHVIQPILSRQAILQADGHVTNTKKFKRFRGALLSAMGNTTFPGGHLNRDDRTGNADEYKVAAAREFIEEFHLEPLLELDPAGVKNLEKNLCKGKTLKLLHTERKGETIMAKFFLLDFDKLLRAYNTDVDRFIIKFNVKVASFDTELEPHMSSLATLQKYLKNSNKESPELRKIERIRIDECDENFLFSDNGGSNRTYMEKQLDCFARLVCHHLANSNELFKKKITPELIAIMSEHLFKHATTNEELGWFRDAMRILKDLDTKSTNMRLFKAAPNKPIELRIDPAKEPNKLRCTVKIKPNPLRRN